MRPGPAAISLAAVALAAGAASCANDRIEVAVTAGDDHERGELNAAVGELRAAGHSAVAFATFSARVLELRPDMDERVAEEAERAVARETLIALRDAEARGDAPADVVRGVWPLALAPALEAPVPGVVEPDGWAPWAVSPGESARAYLVRLCGGALALECKDVVPEGHVDVVGALVVERMAERARRAVATCLICGDESWRQLVVGWEQLAAARAATIDAARAANKPSRWPVAGAAAVALPPESAALRHVHLEPAARAERVRYALADARKDGATAIALLAREPAYPYAMRAYLLATDRERLPVRDGEPVQVLARALDARAAAPLTDASVARRR